MGKYTVRDGETLQMILYAETGRIDVDTVTSDERNKALMASRKARLLARGDVVYLPDKEKDPERGHPATVGETNRYELKDSGRTLRLTLQKDGEVLVGETYALNVEGIHQEGTTDSSGELREQIPLGARTGELVIAGVSRKLVLGGLDPLHKISGIQDRLNNLGFHAGPADGIAGRLTQRAIRKFQAAQKIRVDGTTGPETRKALRKAYGE